MNTKNIKHCIWITNIQIICYKYFWLFSNRSVNGSSDFAADSHYHRISLSNSDWYAGFIYDILHVFTGNSVFDRTGKFNQSCAEYCDQCLCLYFCCLDRPVSRQNAIFIFWWSNTLDGLGIPLRHSHG